MCVQQERRGRDYTQLCGKSTGGREVPAGCVIHHLDWNKTHNEVSNLICVTTEEHEMIHNKIGGEAGKKFGYELVESRVDGLPGGVI